MRFRERDQSSIRSYQRISLGKRKRLVELINQQGVSLSKASKKLKIKLTTARLILKKFNQTGTFPMRNFRSKIKKSPRSQPSHELKHEEQSASNTIYQIGVQKSPEEFKLQVPVPMTFQLPNICHPFPFYQPYWPTPYYNWPY